MKVYKVMRNTIENTTWTEFGYVMNPETLNRKLRMKFGEKVKMNGNRIEVWNAGKYAVESGEVYEMKEIEVEE